MPVSALQSTLTSNNTRLWAFSSQVASEKTELDEPVMELSSTVRHACFSEDAASTIGDLLSSQEPQLSELKATNVPAKGMQAAGDSNVHSLTATESRS